jgi:hypothetical protein
MQVFFLLTGFWKTWIMLDDSGKEYLHSCSHGLERAEKTRESVKAYKIGIQNSCF